MSSTYAATAAPVAPPASQPTRTTFPQPVRDYVSRAFMADNAIPGVSDQDIGLKLKQVISNAAENNLLALIDWPTYELPQQIIRRERSMLARTNAPYSQYPVLGTKRKSPDPSGTTRPTTPPWRQPKQSLADRLAKQEKRQKTTPASKFGDSEKRRQRFEADNTLQISPTTHNAPIYSPSDRDGPIVGTCTKIEKRYFRLTAPPVPESVRPLSVLKATLDFLIVKWKDEHDYGYICDQFKSLRQDLTVQHIKNAFTVRVYEAHARIALEKGDMSEYNQCQGQLRILYKLNIPGCAGEFLAYRILYLIYSGNRESLGDLIANLTPTDKQNPAVHQALLVRKALAANNYHKFFRLYDDPPNMGGYLMDMFVDRERLTALSSISKAYKPDVKVDFVTAELSFENDQQCAQFICDYGAEQLLEQRDGGVRFATGKAGPIFEAARQKAFGRVDIKGQI